MSHALLLCYSSSNRQLPIVAHHNTKNSPRSYPPGFTVNLLLYYSHSDDAADCGYLFAVGVRRIADEIAKSIFGCAVKRCYIAAERRDDVFAHSLAVFVDNAHALFKLCGRHEFGQVDGVLHFAALDIADKLVGSHDGAVVLALGRGGRRGAE